MLNGSVNGFIVEVSLEEYPEYGKKYLRIHDLRQAESYFDFDMVDNAFDGISTNPEVSYNFWMMARNVYREQVSELIAKAFNTSLGTARLPIRFRFLRLAGTIDDMKVIKLRSALADAFISSDSRPLSIIIEEIPTKFDLSYLMTADINHTNFLELD
jgi:hypothetical protein